MASSKPLTNAAREVRSHARTIGLAAVNRNGHRRTAARWYLFRVLRRLTPSVAVVHDGIWYYVSTADGVIGRHVFSTGTYEQDLFGESLEIIETLTGSAPLRGRILVDVGANIGTTTIPALKVFGASSALAFEPAPANFRLLACNLKANCLDGRVRAFPLALSDRSGHASLEMSDDNWGDHRVRVGDAAGDRGTHGESNRRTLDVPLARLDDVLTDEGVDLDHVGVLWMDTQGHEAHVLAGAQAVLAGAVPTVLEYWPYALARAAGLDRLYGLVAANYRRVVDLRASVQSGSIVQLSADDLPRMEKEYGGGRYTDLILLP